MNNKFKWINNDDKIRELSLRIVNKKVEFNSKLNEAKTISAEKIRLESERKIFDSRELEVRNRLEKIALDKQLANDDISEIESTGLAKWNAYKADAVDGNLLEKMKKWGEQNKDEKWSNRFEAKFGNDKFFTTRDQVLQTITSIAKAIEQIDRADFITKLTDYKKLDGSSAFTTSEVNAIIGMYDRILIHTTKFRDISKADQINLDGTITPTKDKRKIWGFAHSFEKTVTSFFPFQDFFDLITLISPQHDDYKFIKGLKMKAGALDINNQTWAVLPSSNKKLPISSWTGIEIPNFPWYGTLGRESFKEFRIEKGLEDWIKLFYSIFSSSHSREKIIRYYFGSGTDVIPYPKEKLLAVDIKNTTWVTKYTYLRTKGRKKGEMVYCHIDMDASLVTAKNYLWTLDSKERLASEELNAQIAKTAKHEDLIRAEEEKITTKESEIAIIIEAEKVFKEEIIAKTNFTDSDFLWFDKDNMLKAWVAKKLLEDIRWLENDGDDSGEFKNIAQKSLYDTLTSREGDGVSWKEVAKKYFEEKGSTTAERITKINSEAGSTGISLRYFLDVFDITNDAEIITAINKSLTPVDTPPAPAPISITTAEVQNAIVAAVGNNSSAKPEVTVADTWKFPVTSQLGSGEKIRNFVKTYIFDKKADFLAHVDAKLTADKPAGDTEIERIANFLKTKDSKKVIGAVISHKIEQPDQKKLIVDKIVADKKDGKQPLDISKYGTNPGTIENPSDEVIIEYEYREMTGTTHTYQSQQAPEAPGGKDTKPSFWDQYIAGWYYAPIWVPILLVVLAIFYFWDNIANWWNGPAEEGADVDKESE